MAKQLKASMIRVQGKAKTHDTVLVRFALTNTSKQDVSVLTWNTPLDRMITDCLDVTVDGESIEYDGPMIKRGAPTASDYLVLAPGQTVEAEFPVSDAYDTSKPGKYDVKIKRAIGDVVPEKSAVKAATALASGNRAPAREQVSAKTRFTIEKGQGGHLTLGEAARLQEQQMKAAMKATARARGATSKKKPSKRKSLNPARYVGGTSDQQAAARTAHSDGYDLCIAARAGMANNARYVEWFGSHTATRLNRVKTNLGAVKKDMETEEFTYNLTGTGCRPGVFAYTFKRTNTIWFCDAFWSAPRHGTDSKAGTVLHEHTHSDASTDDVRYGQAACRQLAKDNPDAATKNADSHEYYAGG